MTKDKLYHGSFIVSSRAAEILLANNATAKHICAFLTLSCFSKRDNCKYQSTASYNAVIDKNDIEHTKELIVFLGSWILHHVMEDDKKYSVN